MGDWGWHWREARTKTCAFCRNRQIRRSWCVCGRGAKSFFFLGAMEELGFVAWLFKHARSVRIAHKNMGKEAEVMFVYSAAEYAKDIEGRQPTRKEKKVSWSHVMLLEAVMVDIKTASTADRAAILVGLKMLDEVPGLHVQTEGHRCGCKEYVSKMIEALSADGRVMDEFAAQMQKSRMWREMQAQREKQPEKEQPEKPMPMPKRAKTQPSAPKNKNLYTKHLTGLVVTGVLHGGSDSQIALGVKIDDSGKKKMMAHYLKGRPPADLDQMIGAVSQFMSSAQECGAAVALSEYDRVACERFIFLIELLRTAAP